MSPQKKKGSNNILLIVLVCVVLICATALIASGVWDRSDPVVPVSYFKDELSNNIEEIVDEANQAKIQEFNDQLASNLQEYDRIVSDKLTDNATVISDISEQAAQKIQQDRGAKYYAQKLTSGQTLTLLDISEIICLSGEVSVHREEGCYLVDLTAGTGYTEADVALTLNHEYILYGNATLTSTGDSELLIKALVASAPGSTETTEEDTETDTEE